MASQIYDIPNGIADKLKDAFYEVESYKTIMSELVKTNPDNNFDFGIFNDFRNHYKEALITYDKEKINFEFDFVKIKHPNATNWSATFGDNKVIIYYPN
jgi:hypothetical protein